MCIYTDTCSCINTDTYVDMEVWWERIRTCMDSCIYIYIPTFICVYTGIYIDISVSSNIIHQRINPAIVIDHQNPT